MKISNYSIHDNIIPKLLFNCDLYQINDIRKGILSKYREQLNDAIDYYENSVEHFDKDEFMNSLTLSMIPIILGLNRRDYILYLVNLIPDIYCSYNKDSETLKVIYNDSNS